jgi:hypothetical protein
VEKYINKNYKKQKSSAGNRNRDLPDPNGKSCH